MTKVKRPKWLKRIVGIAGDTAEDYFTLGDIAFIQSLLKDQREEIEKKITEFFDEEAWSLAHTDAWENRDKLLAKLKQTK